MQVICVPIVTLEQNNNFIRKYTRAPNVTMYNSRAIVPGECSALSHTSNVSRHPLEFSFLISFFLFAEEMGVSRDTGESGTNFADILSNALPPSSLDKSKEKSSDSSVSFSLNMCRENATLIRRVASGFAETLRYFCTC
jgi:hypothetical protein